MRPSTYTRQPSGLLGSPSTCACFDNRSDHFKQLTFPWIVFSACSALYLLALFFSIDSQLFKATLPLHTPTTIKQGESYQFDLHNNFYYVSISAQTMKSGFLYFELSNSTQTVLSKSVYPGSCFMSVSTVRVVRGNACALLSDVYEMLFPWCFLSQLFLSATQKQSILFNELDKGVVHVPR